ncbi:MAG TPA: threonylcarbamoyl-AMP synthase, partial [Candidatus Parcubacteria bacterium]|nr:threonylcarbamoyl-AMP synthase [Candidatus Parcubacteria bacterium]
MRFRIFKGYNLLQGVSDSSFGSISKKRAVSFLKSLDWQGKKEDIVWAEQVFGSSVHLCRPSDSGKTIKNVDALVSENPGQVLAVVSADCLSLFLFDPKSKAIGLIHGSRRSLTRGIISKTLKEMEKSFLSDPKDILAAFAPHIRVCHYWLKQKTYKRLKNTRFKKYFVAKKGKVYFDLTRLALDELLRAGLKKENIEDCGICTFCRFKKFYSARKKEQNPLVYKERRPRFAAFFALKKPQLLDLREKKIFEKIIEKNARALKKGGVIVFPTDTVYGLIADAGNKKAVKKIFEIKKRKKEKPLPIFVKNLRAAKSLALIGKEKERVIREKWPGPFTFVLKRKKKKGIFGIKKGTIALRIPNYKPLNVLLERVGRPLTATSANLSNRPFCLRPDKVEEQLKESQRMIDFIVSGAKFPFARPSVIID